MHPRFRIIRFQEETLRKMGVCFQMSKVGKLSRSGGPTGTSICPEYISPLEMGSAL